MDSLLDETDSKIELNIEEEVTVNDTVFDEAELEMKCQDEEELDIHLEENVEIRPGEDEAEDDLEMADSENTQVLQEQPSTQIKETEEKPLKVEESPVKETPVEEAPVKETPVEEAPVKETTVEEAPVKETPVEEVPGEEVPVEEAPVKEVPVEEVPIKETQPLQPITYQPDSMPMTPDSIPVKTIINELNSVGDEPAITNKQAKTRRPRRSRALTMKDAYVATKPVVQKSARRTQRGGNQTSTTNMLNRKSRFRKRTENLISLK